MKDVSINKCQNFLIKYYPSTSAVSEKGFHSQNCLATMSEKWWEGIDKGDCFGELLTDLSKAFYCVLHDLLIAKLHAYGVDIKYLRFVYSYLNGRKQRVKINNKYSSFELYLLWGIYSLIFLSVIFF